MAQNPLVRKQWPLGYTPSADLVNGDPNGLLRMDNLRQDETGKLTIARGIQKVNPLEFAYYPDQIYSKNIQGIDAIWLSLGQTGNEIVRSASGTFFLDSTLIGVGSNVGCFGDCLGQVLCLAGKLRIKDNLVNPINLGLQTPGMPSVQSVSQPELSITGTWTTNEGTQKAITSTGVYAEVDANTLRGINTLASPNNTTVIDGGANSDPGNDIFQFTIQPDDSSAVQSITVTILANDANYYQYTWDQSALLPGPSQVSTLSATRSQFTRLGVNPNLNWSSISEFQFTVVCTSEINFQIDNIAFYGGVQGQLNGTYTWIQVNITNNGYYLAKSPPSVTSPSATVINGYATLTPSAVESSVNEIWFFRTTVVGTQVGNQQSFLDQYYQTATTTPGVSVQDTTSDDDAIQIDITLNPYLLSLQPLTDGNGITEDIFAVEGLYNERMLYLSATTLYLSDQLNPDAIDSRYSIKVSGDPTEFNIWVKKLTNNVLILATSKNLYEISGTLLALPDGTIDATITPIGENYPPIGTAGSNAVSAAGSIFYVAADGIRATAGSNSQLISPQLNLLFQNETRAGIPGVVISPFARYALTLGRGRLLVCLPLSDGSRWLFIYDLITQTWRIQYTDPVSLFVTLTDRVLMGYNTSSTTHTAGQLYELDKQFNGGFYDQLGVLQDGYKIYFQTVFDDNQQPNNRKDTFTLKIVANTGGNACSVYISPIFPTDDTTNSDFVPNWIYLGPLDNSGVDTTYFTLSDPTITLAFKYAIKIVDVNLTTKFDLYELTLDYDARPEQLTYLRIQPDNLGTISRKRFINYAFVIDTLGNNITFTPIVDNDTVGFTPTSEVLNTTVKETFIYYFTEEVIGTDISGILSGGVFEFYQLNTNEIVSEKLPVPAEYYVIPANNYGEPNRKRHSSYKFQINTRGQNVQFTPRIDGTNYTPATFNTTEKRTVEYFFESDTIGIDIGGILQSLTSTPFEFYGVVVPQIIEILPARLEYYRIPNTDFGVPSRKRVRTIPVDIDTGGFNVEFQPIVDGAFLAHTSIFNTEGKTTVYHFFLDDSNFGTDYGFQLLSLNEPPKPFEFYTLGQPLIVEELPIPRILDQLGPVRFDKIGKIFGFRVRLLIVGNGYNDTNLKYEVFGDNNQTFESYGTPMFSGTIDTTPGIDYIYEVQFPKSVNTAMMRLVLGPSDTAYYRWDVEMRVAESGMETDAKWVPIR